MIDRRLGKAMWLGAAALSILGFAVSALAAEKMPEWRQQLEFQLRKDHNCEVNYLSRVIIQNFEDRQIVSARAHCLDKRAFDVERERSGKPYTIRECTTLAC